MTDSDQSNRDVLTGARPHPRPEETPSDSNADRVLRGTRETTTVEESVTQNQPSGNGDDTSGDVPSGESGDASGSSDGDDDGRQG